MFELSEENVRILTLYVQRMRVDSIRSSIEGCKKQKKSLDFKDKKKLGLTHRLKKFNCV